MSAKVIVGPQSSMVAREIEAQDAPRLDYLLVAERLGADVLHWHPPPSALSGPKPWRVVRSFGGNVMEAHALLRRVKPGTLVYSTGETWGLPVALAAYAMQSRITHVMYVHRVFSASWLRFLRLHRKRLRVDGWICVTQHQANLLRLALGPGARVTAISQGVDTQFWDPTKAEPSTQGPYILSVGTEMRDYPLLFEAVRGLDVQVIVKASSAWMRETRHRMGKPPPNVHVLTDHLSYVQMRDLYAGAALVVVPLLDTPQAAGITTILEAMAMGKCVVATESRGLPDVVIQGINAQVVPPKVTALKETLKFLLSYPGARKEISENNQRAVHNICSIEAHALSVASFICSVAVKEGFEGTQGLWF